MAVLFSLCLMLLFASGLSGDVFGTWDKWWDERKHLLASRFQFSRHLEKVHWKIRIYEIIMYWYSLDVHLAIRMVDFYCGCPIPQMLCGVIDFIWQYKQFFVGWLPVIIRNDSKLWPNVLSSKKEMWRHITRSFFQFFIRVKYQIEVVGLCELHISLDLHSTIATIKSQRLKHANEFLAMLLYDANERK